MDTFKPFIAKVATGATLTAAEVLSTYGTVIAGTFTLDFGLSEITFTGLTSAEGLESQSFSPDERAG